jgi:putative spermidine/putrescine transport system substrate-binding protein
MTKRALITAAMTAVLFAAAGCGGSDNASSTSSGGSSGGASGALKPPSVPMASAVGKSEGKLNIIVWAGYAEDGSSDKTVNWVTPFEKATGCQVNAKTGNTSDEMVTLMRTGRYDGVSASGDATLRLIAGGDVAPVNTKLVPNYADIYAGLKNQYWNSAGGKMYGIPHGRGANILMWNPKVVKQAPTSWSAVFDKNSPYKGKITAYDSPIYIADAALYLQKHDASLKITNVYELDQKQFDAAVSLLKSQRVNVGQYWSDYTKEQQAFAQGDSVVGTSWQVIANLLDGDKVKVGTTLPSEGSTGWSDTWMIAAKAQHPNCMYKWMNWIVSPKTNAAVAEWFGQAPSNAKACAQTSDKSFCATFHAADQKYFDKVHYWTTPRKSCGDSRGATCMDYSTWVQAWTQIKG